MFDPASFFGHSEFELAIMDMFGGFQEPFWKSYHDKVRAVGRSVGLWCGLSLIELHGTRIAPLRYLKQR